VSAYKVNSSGRVHHGGKTYGEGETIHAEPATAHLWLSAGWVTEAKVSAKRLSAKTVEDEAVHAAD
jgi:hypothetical protein